MKGRKAYHVLHAHKFNKRTSNWSPSPGAGCSAGGISGPVPSIAHACAVPPAAPGPSAEEGKAPAPWARRASRRPFYVVVVVEVLGC